MPEDLQIDSLSLQTLWQRAKVALQKRYSYLSEEPIQPVEQLGATEAELQALEIFWGFPLPPSYRLLLSLFNGTSCFAYNTPLLASTEIIHRQQDWYVVDELNPELMDYVFAAGPDSDLFFAFDPQKPGADGELEIIIYTADGQEERHAHIVAFLLKYLHALEVGIAREQADRAGLED